MSNNSILTLIQDYQADILSAVIEMQSFFNTKQLLKAFQQGMIKQSGILPSGITYEFHGVGCVVTISGIDIDFDFGPNDRCDGFDLWRILRYVREKKVEYKHYFENELLLKRDFEDLQNKGLIINPKWFPGSSLFYFKTDTPFSN